MGTITLVCWCCDVQKHVEVQRLPQFGFEFAGIADRAGWIGLMDLSRARVILVCSPACHEASLTKKGALRATPPKRKAA